MDVHGAWIMIFYASFMLIIWVYRMFSQLIIRSPHLSGFLPVIEWLGSNGCLGCQDIMFNLKLAFWIPTCRYCVDEMRRAHHAEYIGNKDKFSEKDHASWSFIGRQKIESSTMKIHIGPASFGSQHTSHHSAGNILWVCGWHHFRKSFGDFLDAQTSGEMMNSKLFLACKWIFVSTKVPYCKLYVVFLIYHIWSYGQILDAPHFMSRRNPRLLRGPHKSHPALRCSGKKRQGPQSVVRMLLNLLVGLLQPGILHEGLRNGSKPENSKYISISGALSTKWPAIVTDSTIRLQRTESEHWAIQKQLEATHLRTPP
jgi:hypothetical protein